MSTIMAWVFNSNTPAVAATKGSWVVVVVSIVVVLLIIIGYILGRYFFGPQWVAPAIRRPTSHDQVAMVVVWGLLALLLTVGSKYAGSIWWQSVSSMCLLVAGSIAGFRLGVRSKKRTRFTDSLYEEFFANEFPALMGELKTVIASELQPPEERKADLPTREAMLEKFRALRDRLARRAQIVNGELVAKQAKLSRVERLAFEEMTDIVGFEIVDPDLALPDRLTEQFTIYWDTYWWEVEQLAQVRQGQ